MEGHGDDSVQQEMQIVFRNLSRHFARSTLFCVLHMIIAPHFSSITVFASNRLNLQSLKSKIRWLSILSLIRFKSLINKAFFDPLQSKSAPEQSSTIVHHQQSSLQAEREGWVGLKCSILLTSSDLVEFIWWGWWWVHLPQLSSTPLEPPSTRMTTPENVDLQFIDGYTYMDIHVWTW